MDTTEQKQSEWQNILEREALIQQEKETMLASFLTQGYVVVDGQVVPNDTSWAIEWSLDYYSRYIGEVGAMYDRYRGCAALSVEQYETLAEAMKNEDEEYIMDLLGNVGYIDDYILDGMFGFGNWIAEKIDEEGNPDILWEVTQDRGQQALDVGSYFRVTKKSREAIKSNPVSVVTDDID